MLASRAHGSGRGVTVAVDAVSIKHSGGASVLLDFLTAAVSHEDVARIVVYCPPRGSRNYDLPPSGKITECPVASAAHSYWLRLLWWELLLGRECAKSGTDVLVCMCGAGRSGRRCAQVTVVQQSQPFAVEALPRMRIGRRIRMAGIAAMTRRSVRRSASTVVQTPTMREWVSRAFNVSAEGIAVFRPPPPQLQPPTEPSPELAPMRATQHAFRLLYVGNTMPHKNLALLVRGLVQLRREMPGATLFLTCPPDHPLGRAEGVVGLGYLGPAALREAYELATVLVMPSLVETVALPMLEAMDAGTPVLAADRPYAHDVCEDAAEFFDPLSEEDFARKAIALLKDEARRQELVRKGRALVERRRAERPYERMVEHIVAIAREHAASR